MVIYPWWYPIRQDEANRGQLRVKPPLLDSRIS
nr:MAG TPA: hypothetical protein [Caudoviricetes sp.]